jgi:Tol biopolymer transport system component
LEETHPATNDRRSDARSIRSIPYTAHTNTARAGRDADEPGSCAPVGGTVWYRYDADRTIALVATTFGTNHPTSLAVFVKTGDRLEQIGCDSDTSGNAYWPFTAEDGKTYLFQIAGAAGGGDLVFALEPQGKTTIVSSTRPGRAANGSSYDPSVSLDGRYVAFDTLATDIGPDAGQRECGPYPIREGELRCYQVILRDRRSEDAKLVSVTPEGRAGNADSVRPFVSPDGRLVAFQSEASDLVPGVTNARKHIFVRDMQLGRTEPVSVSTSGEGSPGAEGDGDSVVPSMSSDGRYVAFESGSTNLVRGDTNASVDVFVRDRIAGTTTRVSVSSQGAQTPPLADRDGLFDPFGQVWGIMLPSISANGRFVAFSSAAPNLTPGDTNNARDVFVHDRSTRRTELVSISSAGVQGNERSRTSGRSSISADGRYVAFTSAASNLVSGDTNGLDDAFVHDRKTGETVRVSVSSSGEQAETSGNYDVPGIGIVETSISADGRRVAFVSGASNLTPGDENSDIDVFVHDLDARTTIRASIKPGGDPKFAGGGNPWLSGDGATVTFTGPAYEGDLYTQVYVHEMPSP